MDVSLTGGFWVTNVDGTAGPGSFRTEYGRRVLWDGMGDRPVGYGLAKGEVWSEVGGWGGMEEKIFCGPSVGRVLESVPVTPPRSVTEGAHPRRGDHRSVREQFRCSKFRHPGRSWRRILRELFVHRPLPWASGAGRGYRLWDDGEVTHGPPGTVVWVTHYSD